MYLPLYCSPQDEGHVYSVLPYLPGQDLCAFLMHRQEGLPEHQARAVMQQVRPRLPACL
jgi:serine/threonine protein kinase